MADRDETAYARGGMVTNPDGSTDASPLPLWMVTDYLPLVSPDEATRLAPELLALVTKARHG